MCMDVCTSHAQGCPQRPEEGVGYPGIGITEDCDLPCGCWESDLGLLEMQHLLNHAHTYIHNAYT